MIGALDSVLVHRFKRRKKKNLCSFIQNLFAVTAKEILIEKREMGKKEEFKKQVGRRTQREKEKDTAFGIDGRVESK